MPKLDRRIIKSQEAIKTALIELMSEKGFDNITIQDIADRAKLSTVWNTLRLLSSPIFTL